VTANDKYISWLNSEALDAETRKELEAIKNDEKQIEDRFYKDLEFGTGGLRGVLGAGTNRMNVYTVRRAAAGLGKQLIHNHGVNGVQFRFIHNCAENRLTVFFHGF